MKKLLALLLVISATALAGPEPVPTVPNPIPAAAQPYVNEVEAAFKAGWLDAGIQMFYAPNLAKHLGAEFKISHPLTKDSPLYVGVSFAAINGGYWGGSFGGGVKWGFPIPNTKFTFELRGESGAYLPLSTTNTNSNSSSDSLGGYVETGGDLIYPLKVDPVTNVATIKVSLGLSAKYITSIKTEGYGGFLKVGFAF